MFLIRYAIFRPKDGNRSLTVWIAPSKNDGYRPCLRRGRATQAYALQYDGLDRLTHAHYAELDPSGALGAVELYNEQQSYDPRGNILSQYRTGLVPDTTVSRQWQADTLDARLYSYPSGDNRPSDHIGRHSIAPLIEVDVPYTHLNLPYLVDFGRGRQLRMTYDALGRKLVQTVADGSGALLRLDYLDNLHLHNGSLVAVYHAEGRALPTGSGFRHEYTLRDHLGNTRLVVSGKDGSGSIGPEEVLVEAAYYPSPRSVLIRGLSPLRLFAVKAKFPPLRDP